MNREQLRAKALALFHSLVSSWANEFRRDLTTVQEELNQRLDALQERIAQYEEKLDESRILAFADELAAGAGGGGDAVLARVRAAMGRLDRAASLQEVLGTLVQELGQFAPRVALFVLKGGQCIGWSGQGFDQSPGFSNEALKRISVPASADTVFRAVIEGRRSFLGESNAHHDNVQLLSRIGNVLPSTIFATPVVIRDRVAAVVYADSGDGAEPLRDTEAIEIVVSYACRLLDGLSGGRAAPKATTSEIHPSRVEKIRQAAAPPPKPAAEDSSGTVMFEAASLTGAPASRPAPAPTPPPVAAPPPSSPGASAPPTALDPETRKQHEAAERFARLLVSEIKLYREADVEKGRKNRNLYEILKDDIERSRQLYIERVPAPVRATTNYFNEELIRILADGDPEAMGVPLEG